MSAPVVSTPVVRPTIGVLALQGDVREHMHALERCGARAVQVRRPAELAAVDGLVVPGGESTTMCKLATAFEVLEPLRRRVRSGMPAYGSCAGMIMLADKLVDGAEGQETVGGIDMLVRRNAFGRQVDSFEADIAFAGLDRGSPPGGAPPEGALPEGAPPEGVLDGVFRGVFIRAPWVESVGDGVEVLARISGGPAAGRIVAVQQGNLLATSFHPELGGDDRLHRYFVGWVVGRVVGATNGEQEERG